MSTNVLIKPLQCLKTNLKDDFYPCLPSTMYKIVGIVGRRGDKVLLLWYCILYLYDSGVGIIMINLIIKDNWMRGSVAVILWCCLLLLTLSLVTRQTVLFALHTSILDLGPWYWTNTGSRSHWDNLILISTTLFLLSSGSHRCSH